MARGLAQWLAHCEQLGHGPKDRPLDGLIALRDRLGIRFAAPVAIVAGTNGKGSTCAMLESIAFAAGYHTGLYTSPHLVQFEERCRVDGLPVSEARLLPHFEAVEAASAATGQALSGFEFTTLAILRLLTEARPDFVILEVGLGGRLDAVNIIDADVAIITSVALDHQELLGPDRESIGREKAAVMRPRRAAIVSEPQPPASVLEHARLIGADLWLAGRDFRHEGERQQWAWAGRARRYAGLAYPALRGANQLLNAAGVLAAFEALGSRLPIAAQAVREGLATVTLPGRFQIVPGQPTLVLDVAHNEQAAGVLAANLDAMGFHPRTLAVFGAMRDKDVTAMVRRVAPRVDAWFCTALPTPRAASAEELAAAVERVAPGVGVLRCPDPVAALAAAREAADPVDRIVIFGSFFTVGGVLEKGLLPGRLTPPIG
jgi:dihydrofolate synthase/folylpolyglutamate synthase